MPIEEFMQENVSDAQSKEALRVERAARFMPMPQSMPHRMVSALPESRWGIVLAGGDGTRLQKLTRVICGDDRPKQFCALVGSDTLLEQTRIRAERSVRSNQLLYSLSRNHRPFYLEEFWIPASQRIVQPMNKGTAPPILHSLLSIEQIDENAIVAVLPSDHHYSDERAFTAALESAFDIATQRDHSAVLLGATPQSPEVEYGWIEPGKLAGYGRLFEVQTFCEKPSLHVAQELLRRGALWNTFVMVGHVRAFLEMLRTALPALVDALLESALWTGSEVHVSDTVYQRIHAASFSNDVLPVQTRRLVALQLDHVGWSDLGNPERVISILESIGSAPWWMNKWKAMRRPPGAARLSQSALA